MEKPFAPACERNKDPILSRLNDYLKDASGTILEIGSGTGQHIVYFASSLEQLSWYPSDLPENHAGINAWLEEAQLANINGFIPLDVSDTSTWPTHKFDYAYGANITHIMSWKNVEDLFRLLETVLKPQALFFLYGPFLYDGQHTSESNAQFDEMLRARDPDSGIRDVVNLKNLGKNLQLVLDADYDMPANNRLLVWRKK